jgi:hypothetical protein
MVAPRRNREVREAASIDRDDEFDVSIDSDEASCCVDACRQLMS